MSVVIDFLTDKFDTSKWTYEKWIAFHSPILFSIFGSTICFYYVYQMVKQNKLKNAQFIKHIQVRHKHLFISHMLLCWYFILLNPIIATVMIICDLSMEIIYCYGYFFVSLIFLIWGTRMWILFWDYSVSALKIKHTWRKHIDDKQSSFFLNHPNMGKISHIVICLTPLIIIANIFIYLLCYVTQFGELFHITGAIYLAILSTFLNILCINLHRKHNLDNFYMRKEFTWLFGLVSLTLTILVIPYFIITDINIRVWIVGDGISFCCFVTIPVTAKIILNQTSSKYENELKEYCHDISPQVRIIQLLQNPTGINTFAEWLVGEFNVESLIFIIEVLQFKSVLKKYIKQQNKEYIFDDMTSLYFEIPRNIPMSQTINSVELVEECSYAKIAKTIVQKFIEDEYSELSVNVSYEQRQTLSNINFDEYTLIELYTVFDEAFRDILKLLRDPYNRFSRSANYKQVLQLKMSSSVTNSKSNSKTDNVIVIDCQTDKNIGNTLDDKLHKILYVIAKWMNNQCFKCCCQ
eukprot:449911_1